MLTSRPVFKCTFECRTLLVAEYFNSVTVVLYPPVTVVVVVRLFCRAECATEVELNDIEAHCCCCCCGAFVLPCRVRHRGGA